MILKNKIKITGMEKLKPCPFCGYDAEVRMLKYSTGFYNYEIYCPHEYKCYLFGAVEKNFDSAEGAVRAWNQREEGE